MNNRGFIYDIQTNFDISISVEVLKPHQYLVIKCGAKWCGPCQTIQPVFERLADEYRNQLIFGRVDVDTSPQLNDMLNIRALPTFLAIDSQGNIVSRITGANENKLIEMIRGLVSSHSTEGT